MGMIDLVDLERRITALEEREAARANLRQAQCEAQRHAAQQVCDEADRRVIHLIDPRRKTEMSGGCLVVWDDMNPPFSRHSDLSDPQMGELA